jgi:hypothetical protein
MLINEFKPCTYKREGGPGKFVRAIKSFFPEGTEGLHEDVHSR